MFFRIETKNKKISFKNICQLNVNINNDFNTQMFFSCQVIQFNLSNTARHIYTKRSKGRQALPHLQVKFGQLITGSFLNKSLLLDQRGKRESYSLAISSIPENLSIKCSIVGFQIHPDNTAGMFVYFCERNPISAELKPCTFVFFTYNLTYCFQIS